MVCTGTTTGTSAWILFGITCIYFYRPCTQHDGRLRFHTCLSVHRGEVGGATQFLVPVLFQGIPWPLVLSQGEGEGRRGVSQSDLRTGVPSRMPDRTRTGVPSPPDRTRMGYPSSRRDQDMGTAPPFTHTHMTHHRQDMRSHRKTFLCIFWRHNGHVQLHVLFTTFSMKRLFTTLSVPSMPYIPLTQPQLAHFSSLFSIPSKEQSTTDWTLPSDLFI